MDGFHWKGAFGRGLHRFSIYLPLIILITKKQNCKGIYTQTNLFFNPLLHIRLIIGKARFDILVL